MSLWKQQIAAMVADPDIDPMKLDQMRAEHQALHPNTGLSLKTDPKKFREVAENLYGCITEYDDATKLGIVACLSALLQLEVGGITCNAVDWNTGAKLAAQAMTVSQTIEEKKGRHAVDPD